MHVLYFVYKSYSLDRQFLCCGYWFSNETGFQVKLDNLRNLLSKPSIPKFTTVEKVELMLLSVLNSFPHDCKPYNHSKKLYQDLHAVNNSIIRDCALSFMQE